jgi:hypothetical protein
MRGDRASFELMRSLVFDGAHYDARRAEGAFSMITKLLVLVASLATLWAFFKLGNKLKVQSTKLKAAQVREEKRQAAEHQKREDDIIDLEMDPDSGSFEEKR